MATRRAHELAAFNIMEDDLKDTIINLINIDKGTSENFVLFDFRVNIQRNRELFNQFKYFNKIILNPQGDSIPTFEIGGKHFPALTLKSYDNRPGTFRDFFIDNGMDRNSLLRISSASEAFNFWKYRGRNITNNARRAGTLRGNYNNKFDNIALLCIIVPGNRAVYDLDRSKLDSLGDLDKGILTASDTGKKEAFAFRMLGYKYKMKNVAIEGPREPFQESRQLPPLVQERRPEINIERMLKETGGDMRYRNRMAINEGGNMAKKFAASKSVRDAILNAIQNDTADKKNALILLRNLTSFNDNAKYFEDGYIMEIKKIPIDNIYITGILLNLSLIKDNFFTYGPELDFSKFNGEDAEQFKGVVGPTWNNFMEKVEEQKSRPENLMTPAARFAEILQRARDSRRSRRKRLPQEAPLDLLGFNALPLKTNSPKPSLSGYTPFGLNVPPLKTNSPKPPIDLLGFNASPPNRNSPKPPIDLLGFNAFPLNRNSPKPSLSGYRQFGQGGGARGGARRQARNQTKKKKN
jgi:hypothetical protein